MTLIDHFLAEHPFFCALLEHERRILSYYLELYRCPKGSYLVLPNELQEVLWLVVRGRLGEYAEETRMPAEQAEKSSAAVSVVNPAMDSGIGPPRTQPCVDAPSDPPDSAAVAQGPDSPYAHRAAEPGPGETGSRSANEELSAEIERTGTNTPAPETVTQKKLLRYFFPGDLINVRALTQDLLAPNAIISREDDTQVICITAFHLSKLAQQQPKIHRALRPAYNEEGHLISGLPLPIWQQMAKVPPPHTRDLGRQWLQRKPLLHSYNSWYGALLAFFALGALNIWQFARLRWDAFPLINLLLGVLSLLLLVLVVLQRYRCEYTLKRSLLHITERNLTGLSSRIKSYPLLSIRQLEPISLPLLSRIFGLGGLRILTQHGEIIQIFPIDRMQKWLTIFRQSLEDARKLQQQVQNRSALRQFQKWHKLQPELIKEINYRSAEPEGKLQRSLRALAIQVLPPAGLSAVGLFYSLRSELLKIYLTIPLLALGLLMLFQLLRWLRYSWRINEEFLLRQDNFLGHWRPRKIPIREIQNIHLEYLNILGFGTISLQFNEHTIRLQNLKNPQNILDEIESLRHSAKDSSPGLRPDDFLTHRQLELYHDFHHSHLPG